MSTSNPAPTAALEPIAFGVVHLLDEVDRLGDAVPGQMKPILSSTTRFAVANGYSIALDPATNLVTISHTNGGAIIVPRERVKRFEPLPPPKPSDE